MPNSNALRALLLTVGVAGAGIILFAIGGLATLPARQASIAGLLTVLTIASGRFAIKIPGRSATISVSEVFVFSAMLLMGPGIPSLMVAFDGLVTSLRQKRRLWYRSLFNITEPAVSMFCAGAMLDATMGTAQPSALLTTQASVFLGTLAMAGTFFVLNSGLTALAVGFESGSSPLAVWKGHAANLAINFYAAASLAALAVPDRKSINLQALGFVMPLLVLSFIAYREAAKRVDEAEGHVAEVERLYAEARKRDDALRQSQKLEAVGRLAGGVAHDFNNMLTAIRGYGEMIADELPARDPLRNDANEILKAADRAAGLSRQLLAFSRRSIVAPRVVRVEQVVSSMDSMLRRLIGEDILLTTSVAPEVSPVRIDPNELEQVLLNLAVNARDAMPGGGTLRVVLANTVVEAPRHGEAIIASGSYVELSVTDTGCGMTDEVKSRVFEPFFTTKAEGRGTGLGLATVYGVVEKAGGTIEIDSELGRGTSFRILLPASDEAVSAAPDARQVAPARGTATVLLVEDEPSVATLISAALKKAGYTVLGADDAKQALDLARVHPGPIDLLLTDVVMPGMNGRELSDRIVKSRRGTRVLFMSGYSDDTVLLRGVETSSMDYIQKPFSMQALTAKIGSVLSGEAAVA